MIDLSNSPSSVEKLNKSNYNIWYTCIKCYLKGQDLWDIIGGDKKAAPFNRSKGEKNGERR